MSYFTKIRGFMEDQWFRKPPEKTVTPAEARTIEAAKTDAKKYVKCLEVLAVVRKQRPAARSKCVTKMARRLYRGKAIDRPWRSYLREPAILYTDGKVML